MADRQPTAAKNLDIYGNPPIEWSEVLEQLDRHSGLTQSTFLGTVSPSGRVHIVALGAAWREGSMYFTSGPGALKSRNLAANPSCSIAGTLPGMDIVLEGTAEIVRDSATLEALAAQYREHSWPAQVEGDALTAPYSAQSAGPPPWNLYRLDHTVVHVVTTEEPYRATLWRF